MERARHRSAHAALVLAMALALLLTGCDTAKSTSTAAPQRAAGAQDVPPIAAAAPASASHQLTYVAIGASDAFGVGASDPIHHNWPALLATQIAARNGGHVRLVDLGIPGATVAQATQDELPVLVDATPDVISVLLGTNDLLAGTPAGDIEAALDSLVFTLRFDYPQAKLLVGNLPDLTRLPYFASRDTTALRGEIALLNLDIATTCESAGATLVDIFDATAQGISAGDVAADGLHPTDAGATAIANAFAAALQQSENPAGTATPTASPTAPPTASPETALATATTQRGML